MEKQEQFNKALVDQLQKIDRGSLERHNQLTQSLKESMDQQKLIAASEEGEKKNKRKGSFRFLLGKKTE